MAKVAGLILLAVIFVLFSLVVIAAIRGAILEATEERRKRESPKGVDRREAEDSAEPMTVERAERITQAYRIVGQYGAALAKGPPDNGIARDESYLPCSKDKIVNAFKVVLAFEIEHRILTPKAADQLVAAAPYLGSFVADDKADRINNDHKRDIHSEEHMEFIRGMANREVLNDLESFIRRVQTLDRQDPLYRKKVFELIGLEY